MPIFPHPTSSLLGTRCRSGWVGTSAEDDGVVIDYLHLLQSQVVGGRGAGTLGLHHRRRHADGRLLLRQGTDGLLGDGAGRRHQFLTRHYWRRGRHHRQALRSLVWQHLGDSREAVVVLGRHGRTVNLGQGRRHHLLVANHHRLLRDL